MIKTINCIYQTLICGATILLTSMGPASFDNEDPFTDVYAVLVRQADGKEQSLNNNNTVKLTTKTVHLKESAWVVKILSDNGIYADAESFNLIFALNPQLRSLILKSNTTLIIPAVDDENDPAIKKALSEGFLVVLTTNVTLKKDLIQLSKSLKNNVAEYTASAMEQPQRKNDRELIINTGTATANLLEALRIMINGRTRPLNIDMLRQTKDEALIIDSILSGKKKQLSLAELERINSISDNMQLRAGLLEEVRGPGQLPEPYPEQDIAVRVISADGKEVKGLRVYFVPPALIDNPEKINQFPQLSSPATGRLPVANYRIWVGQPGNATPVSDIFPLKLRKTADNEPLRLELVIK